MSSAIIAGTLEELDLHVIMEVMSLGRQRLRLDVSRATGEPIGHVVLKAGRVVGARCAGGLLGDAALATILQAERSARFQIVKENESGQTVDHPITITDRRAPPPPPKSQDPSIGRTRVMEGSLSDFDLPTVLQTIGVGRQFIEVEVFVDNHLSGLIRVKAGKVVIARCGDFEGVPAIKRLLEVPPSARFVASRLTGAPDERPLGSLNAILLEARAARPHRPTAPYADTANLPRVSVLQGQLTDFDLRILLQTIGSGRQHIGVDVYDAEKLIGTIYTKSGMVISARAGLLTAEAAFHLLLQAPQHSRFEVFRVLADVPGAQPMGTISALLLDEHVNGVAVDPEWTEVDPIAPTVRPPTANPTAAPVRIPVMVGCVSDFDIATLLDTLTVNRQLTAVEIHRNSRVLGTIEVKAGRIIRASTEDANGSEALESLMAAPPDAQFHVFRMSGTSDTELGSVAELIAKPVRRPPTSVPILDAPISTIPDRRRSSARIVVITAVVGVAAAAAILLVLARSADRKPSEEKSTPRVAQQQPVAVTGTSPSVAETSTTAGRAPATTPDKVDATPRVDGTAEEAKRLEVRAAEIKAAEEAKARDARIAELDAARNELKITWRLQTRLRDLGYNAGPIDNIYGRQTRTALLAFQAKAGLPTTGVPDDATLNALVPQPE